MRVEAGAVVDEFELPGIGHVVARHARTKTPDGGVTWACTFTIVANGTSDLAVVHRLSAPSLADGRRSVRHAVEFLAGRAMTAPAAGNPGDSAGGGVPGRHLGSAPDRGIVPSLGDIALGRMRRIPVFELPATTKADDAGGPRPVDPSPSPLP